MKVFTRGQKSVAIPRTEKTNVQEADATIAPGLAHLVILETTESMVNTIETIGSSGSIENPETTEGGTTASTETVVDSTAIAMTETGMIESVTIEIDMTAAMTESEEAILVTVILAGARVQRA
ncbi:hypothetical protein BGZ65_003186 [Modicella reniformis]|uniref:Uncharacterized protein n=1 Tax=Modicella reniformis TaxID=1440133 RepID=A0A9P6STU3_9FUNG|nr:hypothetical protein BGZ65_003186 [Modicella reniformis]